MKITKNERWSASFIRIGNKAVREAQARNRELGIVNWYSVNGQLVNDAVVPEPNPDQKPPVTSPL
jgi:hypothetical protein